MEFSSYFENDTIVRPVAANYINMELELESESESELYGEVYPLSDKIIRSDAELKSIQISSDIDKLRQFLEGKYVFEEGETLAAFDPIDDREHVCVQAYSYIKSLSDFEHIFYKWSLNDASIWALDIVKYHIGTLNAAEIYAVVNMMLEEMCLLDN
jgi:hypothetical protein